MDAQSAVPVDICATYPAGLGDTRQNLLSAAAGEREEWTLLYNNFAEIAVQEGFKDVAATFDKIAEVEKEHEARYLKLAENIINDRFLPRTHPYSGNAAIVAILWKDWLRRRFARPANIHASTSKSLR
jgi:rubrerythrin